MSVMLMGAVWKLDIAPVPKLVMMALADHANDDGKCWPGRKKIAEKVGVGLVTLDKHIKFLVAKGYLLKEERYREDGSQSSNHYNINVLQIFPPPAPKLDPPQPQGLTLGEPHTLGPHESPFKPSKGKTICAEQSSPPADGIPYKEIIDHLNQTCNRQFRVVGSTREIIRGRWQEGFRLDDFKKVIDIMCAKWGKDPAMHQYLRPETLFRGSKFQGYLNSEVVPIEDNTPRSPTWY